MQNCFSPLSIKSRKRVNNIAWYETLHRLHCPRLPRCLAAICWDWWGVHRADPSRDVAAVVLWEWATGDSDDYDWQ